MTTIVTTSETGWAGLRKQSEMMWVGIDAS